MDDVDVVDDVSVVDMYELRGCLVILWMSDFSLYSHTVCVGPFSNNSLK